MASSFTFSDNTAQGILHLLGSPAITIQGTSAGKSPLTDGQVVNGNATAMTYQISNVQPEVYVFHIAMQGNERKTGFMQGEDFTVRLPFTMPQFPGWHVMTATGSTSGTIAYFIHQDSVSQLEQQAKAAGHESVDAHWDAIHKDHSHSGGPTRFVVYRNNPVHQPVVIKNFDQFYQLYFDCNAPNATLEHTILNGVSANVDVQPSIQLPAGFSAPKTKYTIHAFDNVQDPLFAPNEGIDVEGPYGDDKNPKYSYVIVTGKSSKMKAIYINPHVPRHQAEELAKTAGYDSVVAHLRGVLQNAQLLKPSNPTQAT